MKVTQLLVRIFVAMAFFFSSTPCLFADDTHIDSAMDELDEEGVFTYGPDRLIQSIYNESFLRTNQDNIDLRNSIENPGRDPEYMEEPEDLPLVGPRSGGSGSVVGEDIPDNLEEITVVDETIEIPADEGTEPDFIVEYLNSTDGIILEHKTVFSDGKYKLFFLEEGESTDVKMAIFGIDGNLLSIEQALNEWTGSEPLKKCTGFSVTECRNGNAFVYWKQFSPLENGSIGLKTVMKVFDADGNELDVEMDTTVFGGNLLYSNLGYQIESTGDFLFLWRYEDADGGIYLKAQIVDQDGKKVGGQILLDSSNEVDKYAPGNVFKVHKCADGNLALVWIYLIYDQEQGNFRHHMKVQVFSPDGTSINDAIIVDTTPEPDRHKIGNSNRVDPYGSVDWYTADFYKYLSFEYVDLQNFGNGNFVMSYTNKDDATTRVQLFKPDGTFAGDYIVLFDSVWGSDLCKVSDFKLLKDGNILCVSKVISNERAAPSFIDIKVLDQNGGIDMETSLQLTQTSASDLFFHRIDEFDNGNFAIFWTGVVPGGSKNEIHMQVFSRSGEPLGPLRRVSDNFVANNSLMNVRLLSNNKLQVLYTGSHYGTKMINGYLMMYTVYDSEGGASEEYYLSDVTQDNIINIRRGQFIDMPNGNYIFWWEEWLAGGGTRDKIQFFSQDGAPISEPTTIPRDNIFYVNNRPLEYKMLPNGLIAVFIIEFEKTDRTYNQWAQYWGLEPRMEPSEVNDYSLSMQIFDQDGNTVNELVPVTDDPDLCMVDIASITVRGDRGLEIVWKQKGAPQDAVVVKKSTFNLDGIQIETIPEMRHLQTYGNVSVHNTVGYKDPLNPINTYVPRYYGMRELLIYLRNTRGNPRYESNPTDTSFPTSQSGALTYTVNRTQTINTLVYVAALDEIMFGAITADKMGRNGFSFMGIERFSRDSYLDDDAINLESVIDELSGMDRTEAENSILEASKFIYGEQDNLDRETLKEFEEAIHTVRMAETMRDLLPGVDFKVLDSALGILLAKQRELYSTYINSTQRAYGDLGQLLSLDAIAASANISNLTVSGGLEETKERIIVDIYLHKLLQKEASRLTETEKEALGIYKNVIKPAQDKYRSMLEHVMGQFIFAVKKALLQVKAVSVHNTGSDFKALFSLDGVTSQ